MLSDIRRRITDVGLKTLNAAIQWVTGTVWSYRNPEHFKVAIYFGCAGIDLYPHETR